MNTAGPMRIGVDALNLLHDRRGIWRYAQALLRRWIQTQTERVQITLLLPHAWPALVRRSLARDLGVKHVEVAKRHHASKLGLHAVWYPWNGMTWVAPLTIFATIHDVWPFESPSEDLQRRRSEQLPFRTTAAHATAILTDSAFSRAEIIRHLSVPPNRLHVVPLGADGNMQQSQPLLLDGVSRFVLFVGEHEPRKDLLTLQTAMRQLPDTLRMTTGIAIAGKLPSSQQRVGRIERTRAGGGRGITWILRFEPYDGVPTLAAGGVPEDLLDALYSGAAVFAFPSRYEGFGLPILEAMTRGAPVVAARAASIPEVAGDAAIYFPPGDAAALSREMARVLADPALAVQLRAAGLARANTFSWDRCADQTLRVFEHALGRHT